MENKITPISDRVVVEPILMEAQTQSGIYIPDSAKEKPSHGKVIAVGPGKDNQSVMNININDTVLHGKYSGTEISVNNSNYLVLRELEIYGTIV